MNMENFHTLHDDPTTLLHPHPNIWLAYKPGRIHTQHIVNLLPGTPEFMHPTSKLERMHPVGLTVVEALWA